MSPQSFTKRLTCLAIFSAMCILGNLAVGQQPPQKVQGKSTADRIEKKTYDFKEAGKAMEYGVFVHSKYSKSTKTPLMVALHGLGSNPQQILRYPGLTDLAEKHGFIVVAPMGYNSGGWYGAQGLPGMKAEPKNLSELSEKDVMNVLALIRKEYNVDDQRIYLMGHSMGGGGTWHIGMKYPDIWAALAPIAPAIFTEPTMLDKIKHIPVMVVQGDKDPLVKVEVARKWVAKMKELRMNYEYIEIPGGGHVDVAYTSLPQIFEFFNKHHKKDIEKVAVPDAEAKIQVTVERNSNAEASPAFKFKKVPSPAAESAASKANVSIVSGKKDANGAAVKSLVDGKLPKDEDEPKANFFFSQGSAGGRVAMDFGSAIDIKQINTYSWHPNTRGPQVYKLYASDGSEKDFNVQPTKGAVDPAKAGWKLIATVDTRPKQGEEMGGQYGVSIADATGAAIGRYRYLLFDMARTEDDDPFGNTFYSEITVIERK